MSTSPSLVLSYDIGTTSTKSCLYRIGDAVDLIGSAMAEYPIRIMDGGRAEQDPRDWVNAVVKTTREILAGTGIPPKDIKGLSFSSQMQGLVLIDENGVPVRPAMSYMDQRAVEQKQNFGKGPTIDDIPLTVMADSIRLTGIAPTSVKDPIWKYHWVRQNEPELFKRVRTWFDVKDYLIFVLTGEKVCTRDSACAAALFDNRPGRNRWSPSLCRAYNVDPGHLPRIIESHELAGELQPGIADASGLTAGIPVYGGGGDASTIGLGAGAVGLNSAHLYMGTSGWISVVTDRRVLDINRKIASITCAIPGRYHYFCEQETSGKCLEWVRDHLALDEIGIYLKKVSVADDPETVYKNLFEYLNEVIGAAPAGADGVLFAPWLHGSRSPFEDPDARGMFFNIGLNTGKRDMIRAVVEGVAYNSRWMLESIEKNVACSGPLRFVGGGALSDVTAQIMSDVLQRELEVPENPHNAGALGAALIAAYGSGTIPSMEEIPVRVPVRQTFKPSLKNSVVYERQYPIYKQLYPKNRTLFKALNSTHREGAGDE